MDKGKLRKFVVESYKGIVIGVSLGAAVLIGQTMWGLLTGGEDSGKASAIDSLTAEMIFVVGFSVILAVAARCLYSLFMYPHRWNPFQRINLPGEDEGRDVNAALTEELSRLANRRKYEAENPDMDHPPITDAEAHLVSQLALASAKRGHARLIADGIGFAAIVFANILAFAPMAKSLMRSFI